MPSIGEIKSGKELGYPGHSGKYTWIACPGCQKERWLYISDAKKGRLLCLACARKMRIERIRKNGTMLGAAHPSWKGGRYINGKGYVMVSIDSKSPYWSMRGNEEIRKPGSGYILEHRLVMAQELGRCLTQDEKVHHKNGIKNDNRPYNLRLLTKEHQTSYEAGYRQGFKDAAQLQNEEQKKQNRLLRWEIKQLREDLQFKL